MYPEYYAEQEKRVKDKLMELKLRYNNLINALNHEKW